MGSGTSEASTATRKVVLVTGASAGIGAAVAREAGAKGHHVALTARRADRLERLAEEIAKQNPGIRAVVVPADLDDPASPERIINDVLEHFGRLDVLINNAGFGLPTLFADGDPVAIRRQIEVNLIAPLMLTRHAIPALRSSRGMVVNVGSSISCLPNPALGAYGATKAGLAYWNEALRRELWDDGITVCLVEPGPVKTEFFDALMALSERGGRYHAMLDAPAGWMSADVRVAARRIVRLIDRPKRRLSVLKRVVWPWRTLGAFFRVFPFLGDLGVTSVLRFYDRRSPRRFSAPTSSHPTRVS